MKKAIYLFTALALMVALLVPAAADTCTHRWVEATAEEPGYCIRCGALDYDHMNYYFPEAPFTVTVLKSLNCRRLPDITSQITRSAGEGTYTIVEVRDGWGRLESSAGWISLINPSYVSIQWGAGSSGSKPSSSPVSRIRSAEVGETVTFGSYEQDNHSSNGQEPIEWIVLAKKDSRVLLLSKYCLDARPYNSTSKSVTWETCTLRSWLNDTFLYDAFTSEERSYVPYVTLKNKDSSYGIDGGKSTSDRVFLLSYGEADSYFRSNASRTVSSTAYAKAQGAYVCSHGDSWWWLRGPGGKTTLAALVGTEGNVNDEGNFVNRETGGVRPAIWIELP